MFVIELTYTADLERIDARMREPMGFLKKHYASGHFLVSGRKIPREGGIILAVGKDREEIEAIARQDPFVTHGLADVRVIEFRASQRAENVQAALDKEPAREPASMTAPVTHAVTQTGGIHGKAHSGSTARHYGSS